MMNDTISCSIEDFFENRDRLILSHMNGEIDKKQFLELNYNYMIDNRVKPFVIIDSFEKGMYNYQFYNIMAKYNKMLAQEIKASGKNIDFYAKYLDNVKYYYDEKDKTIFRLLRYLKYNNIEAYYVSMESTSLNGKLYEIVLKDYEYAVLHSCSEWMLSVLRKENVFLDQIQKSVIDYYVNNTY